MHTEIPMKDIEQGAKVGEGASSVVIKGTWAGKEVSIHLNSFILSQLIQFFFFYPLKIDD